MRKAPETRDRIMVQLRVLHVVPVQRTCQRKRTLLVDDVFGMLERHVEEHPQRRIDLAIETCIDGACRVVPRQRVSGVCMRALRNTFRGS